MYAYLAGLETRQDVFALQTGLQGNVLPKPVTPFLGAGLAANWFGVLDAEVVNDTVITISDLEKHCEAGAFVSAGIRIKIKQMIVELQARYTIDNIFTRQKDEKNIENRYLGANLVYLFRC